MTPEESIRLDKDTMDDLMAMLIEDAVEDNSKQARDLLKSLAPRVPWKRVIQAIRNGKQVDRHKKDDKLFITEIINDLYRNGFVAGRKACTMLQDWAIELRESSRAQLAASRLKRTFNNEIGAENW